MKPFTTGCRVCGESTEGGSRELCQKHYRRFNRRLDRFATEAEKKAFDDECVAAGWIASKSKGGRPKQDNDPFGEIAEMISESTRQAAETRARYESSKPPASGRDKKKPSNKKTS